MMTDNKIINVQDIWLDVDAVATLKGITKRAIRLSIRQGKYISKTNNIRGGKSYRILLSSLEPEIQNKYLNEYYNSLVIRDVFIILKPVQDISPAVILPIFYNH